MAIDALPPPADLDRSDVSDVRGAINALKGSPAWAYLAAEHDALVAEITARVMAESTPDDEANKLRKAVAKLRLSHPHELAKRLSDGSARVYKRETR